MRNKNGWDILYEMWEMVQMIIMVPITFIFTILLVTCPFWILPAVVYLLVKIFK
jgi:hypothetical protein